MDISLLKDKYKGEDIWLILAGSSMDHVDPSFFSNKITIGQNQTYRKYPCTYVVMKDCNEKPRFPHSIKELEELDIPLIYSKHFKGCKREGINKVEYDNSYVFSHNPKTSSLSKEIEKIAPHEIITGKSTVTSLMHIAAFMGAKNIILCGHDCGYIDGNLYYQGYVEKNWTSAANWGGIKSWMGKLESQTQLVKKYLKERYKCNIYSLNPFLNFDLEGHKYKKIERR